MNEDLKEAFGNEGWPAGDLYRQVMLQFAKPANHVLELGSGLTSLDLARADVPGIALEHLPEWIGYVSGVAADMKVDFKDFQVLHAPLKDYGHYEWYDFESNIPFDFVVCDGPPRWPTKGGRYGFLPQMIDTLESPCYILYDDYFEGLYEGNRRVSISVRTWQEKWDVEIVRVYEPEDDGNPFALLKVK